MIHRGGDVNGRSLRGRHRAWSGVEQRETENATTLISNHHQETWSPYLSKRDVRVIYLHTQRRIERYTYPDGEWVSIADVVSRRCEGGERVKGVLLSQGGIIIENAAGRSLTAGNQ
ncbi:hypothetical protein K0M31_014761, partial [Melipona bicolor]